MLRKKANRLSKGISNIYLKVTIETFSKLQFSGFKKFVTRSVFEKLQLTQTSLNFKTPCYNGLVVKTLDSQSRSPVFKSTGWLQGRLSLSSFRGR